MKNVKIINEAEDNPIYNIGDIKLTSFIPSHPPQSNPFIKMLNDEYVDEEEKNNDSNYNHNDMEKETNITNITKQDLFKLQDNELYEFMDFENSIKNWNDFCQVIISLYSLYLLEEV